MENTNNRESTPTPPTDAGGKKDAKNCADGMSCGTSCGFLDQRIASFMQCTDTTATPSFPDPCQYARGGEHSTCEDRRGFDSDAYACAPAMSLGGIGACTMVQCASDGSVASTLDASLDATAARNCCRTGGGAGGGGTMDPICRTVSPTGDGCLPPQCYRGFVPPECSGGGFVPGGFGSGGLTGGGGPDY